MTRSIAKPKEKRTPDQIAKLAPVRARQPAPGRTWVASTEELADMLRAYPGDPNYPVTDERSGWRIVGVGNEKQGPTLTQNAMRIKKGLLPPFQDTRGGMFEASVSTDPRTPNRTAPTELWARWLSPENAAIVRAKQAATRRAGKTHIVHREVPKLPMTPEQIAERAARKAAKRAKQDTPPAVRAAPTPQVQPFESPVVFSDVPLITGLP